MDRPNEYRDIEQELFQASANLGGGKLSRHPFGVDVINLVMLTLTAHRSVII